MFSFNILSVEYQIYNSNYQASLNTPEAIPVVGLNLKELYNPSYVLDDDDSNGRKSVDYFVDHIDDFESSTEAVPSSNLDKDTLNTPIYPKTQAEVATDFLTSQRKRPMLDAGSPKMKQARMSANMKTTDTKNNKRANMSSTSAIRDQNSLLKAPESKRSSNDEYGQQTVYIKKEQDYGQSGMVPDIISAQDMLSPATGNGKSFYSKDDLFSDEVPAELFDDGSCVSI